MKLTQSNNLSTIIEGCKAGNSAAQQKLYDAFAGKMFAICLRYAKDRMDAEDILQIGFVKIFNKIKDFKNEGSLEGWIRKIMVNTAIENYRKNVRLLEISSSEMEAIELADSSIFDRLEMEDLLKLVNCLADGYRLVFNMYVIEGYSHSEIAATLGISESGSKSQLSRARQLLKSEIKKMEALDYAKNYR